MSRQTLHCFVVLLAGGLHSTYAAYAQSPSPTDNGVLAKVADGDGYKVGQLLNQFEADAKNHGQYVSRVAHLANDLYKRGVISQSERQDLKRHAAQSSVGK